MKKPKPGDDPVAFWKTLSPAQQAAVRTRQENADNFGDEIIINDAVDIWELIPKRLRGQRGRTHITINGRSMLLRRGTYFNQREAITIIDTDGVPFLTLTCNLPDSPLAPGEFFVKDWSENAPYIQQIILSGYFTDTGKRVRTGFVAAKIWRWKDAPEEVEGEEGGNHDNP